MKATTVRRGGSSSSISQQKLERPVRVYREDTNAAIVRRGGFSRSISQQKLELLGSIRDKDLRVTIRGGRLELQQNIINILVIYSDQEITGVSTSVDILLELGNGMFLDLGDGTTFLNLNTI